VGDDLELGVAEHGDRLGLELAADLDAQVDALGGQRGPDLVDAVGQLGDLDLLDVGRGDDRAVPAATAARAYSRLCSSVSGPSSTPGSRWQCRSVPSSDPMLAPVPVVAHVAPAVEPLQLLAPTVAGALYALRVRALARQGRAVPRGAWRASRGRPARRGRAGALGHLGEERFSAHMAEHLLLGDVGALLIVLGLTGPCSPRRCACAACAGCARSPIPCPR
jgi:hypothetical protein